MIINIPEIRKTSISEVMNWLKFNKKEISDVEMIFNNLSINLHNNNSLILPQNLEGFIWNGSKSFLFQLFNDIENIQLKNSLYKEGEVFLDALFYMLKKRKFFGNISNLNRENKISDLIIASQCGLSIPDTLVTQNKMFLKDFFNKHIGEIITKSLGGSIRFETSNEILWGKGTTKVTRADIDETSDYFLLSLFQENIEKEYEIRSFLFKKKFFSMAIFSQKDNKTSLDFRNYNHSFPNRMVPFKLPDKIEKKLLKFAEMTDLDTGSFDLIVTKKEKEFIFLEVNPYGQFGWLSKNCNYYLEKQIAEYFEN